MKLTYQNLNDQTLSVAFQKLGNMPFSPKVAYNINRIQGKLASELKGLQKLFLGMLKKHAELDEKGEVKAVAGPGSYKIRAEQMEAFKKDHDELMNIPFELDKCQKIRLSDIEEVSKNIVPNQMLTAFEMGALEPFLVDLEVVPETDAKAPASTPPKEKAQPTLN